MFVYVWIEIFWIVTFEGRNLDISDTYLSLFLILTSTSYICAISGHIYEVGQATIESENMDLQLFFPNFLMKQCITEWRKKFVYIYHRRMKLLILQNKKLFSFIWITYFWFEVIWMTLLKRMLKTRDFSPSTCFTSWCV